MLGEGRSPDDLRIGPTATSETFLSWLFAHGAITVAPLLSRLGLLLLSSMSSGLVKR